MKATVLPKEWACKKLSEVSTVTDRDHRTPKYTEIGYPLVSPKIFTKYGIDLSNAKYVGEQEYQDFKRKCHPENGDVLYSRIGTIGEARLVDFHQKFVALHSIALIKPKDEDIDSKYLTYLLNSPLVRRQATANIKSIAVPDLGLKRIENFIVPIPPLDTQRKIVAILEKAEATQRLRTEADALTQKFLQSVFLELFGDLMTNQMGWDILSIEQCLAKIIDYRGKTPHKEEKGIPLITAKLIKNGKISPPEEFISPSSYDEWMSRGLPQKGDVIFTTEGPLGEVAQIQTDDKIALAQRVLTLRGKSEMIDNTFLAHELRSEFIKRQLNRLSTGSTVKGIRQSEFRKIRLFVPPLKIQKRFVEIVKTIEKCQLLQQNQRSDVNYLYDSLMNKAFTGELIA